ncbi:hypothetical protein, partial [Gluconacetobacter sp.]|uniref:hypothetical protein n=1 Tax=Gluconacetobacter sp. TaxID=1935994 RepID=UPI0039E770D8
LSNMDTRSKLIVLSADPFGGRQIQSGNSVHGVKRHQKCRKAGFGALYRVFIACPITIRRYGKSRCSNAVNYAALN